MTRFDRFVVVLVLVMSFAVAILRHAPDYDPGNGRRPLPPAPPAVGQPPSPLPDRVRRPPLGQPDAARDPVFEVDVEPVPAGKMITGTAFSVDPGGVWVTARHVASDLCRQLALVVNGRPVAATLAFVDPQADLTVLRTRGGAPATPLATEPPTVGEAGFSFGYPTGILGATQDTLMGRSRMQLSGRLAGTTPTLTWAETSRFPDTLETLGGMSGGPMYDRDGRVVGSVVAATRRRARVNTVAPEVLRQVGSATGLYNRAPEPRPVGEITGPPEPLSDIAKALSSDSRIAKVYCRPAS